MIVTALLEQLCNKPDNINKLATGCQQLVPNLLTTCNKQCKHSLLTACLQTCYNCEIFTCVVEVKCIINRESNINLFTSCQQVAFAVRAAYSEFVVTSLEQVVNNL